ncbi:hypothetical protein BS47DRAFT_1367922 [Hydnum rufescens UP504]|uniref:FAD-binding PCMH-type domain-containing protein n=1 Tax=Hydnum rufescens UP504 TaxID=1448309 RepID=A0A9P6AGX8_9AGAM|nr:hypothetical protein BS47DRAFT_1367922 [Hydnum rufescens UP504]
MFSFYAALALLSQPWYWFIPQNIDGLMRIILHAWPSSVPCPPVPKFSIPLKILGTTSTPFAIKSGGHTANQGFSSTSGVQIALSRFNAVMYDQASNTATIGAGLTWDEVYPKLEPFGVTVTGGRISGVGVGGFTLGGGYSWISNRHGLAIDSVVAFELVLPDGEITMVTANSNPELSFALKGGYNNFGIVTNFVFKTFPMGPVWGGLLTYTGANIGPVVQAIADFSANNIDADANLVAASIHSPWLYTRILFLAIPRTNGRCEDPGAMHSVSLSALSVSVISQILNQTDRLGQLLRAAMIRRIPTTTSSRLWHFSGSDSTAREDMKLAAAAITAAAQREGQQLADLPLYSNYALADVPLHRLYTANLPRLRRIKMKYDPLNIMGLAGGFRF